MVDAIRMQPLLKLEDMPPAVELQRIYWGSHVESVVAGHMLYSIVNAGGHVLGAYDGDRLIGVLIGLVALDPDTSRPLQERLQIASKRMVVLPEYRSHGIGARLKLAQRQEAIRQGIRLVTWTFDPLLSANAHLNIRKLRAISRCYLLDYYGNDDSGGLSRLGSSDRLLVEWRVADSAVIAVLDQQSSLRSSSDYMLQGVPMVNAAGRNAAGLPMPASDWHVPREVCCAMVEIPSHYDDLLRLAPQVARAWQTHIREVFMQLFERGFMVTDFIYTRDQTAERSLYVLSQLGDGEATA